MKIGENKHYWKISILFIREEESQIQDLGNRENKSNINRSDGGLSTMVKTHMKLYVLHLFKQSTTLNGESWGLINSGIFYGATLNFQKLIWKLQ